MTDIFTGYIFIGLDKQLFSYPSILSYVLGAQKNRLIETVLLSTHIIMFWMRNKKINFFVCTLI